MRVIVLVVSNKSTFLKFYLPIRVRKKVKIKINLAKKQILALAA